jgi:membrane protein DedA with SNARE-associated domain
MTPDPRPPLHHHHFHGPSFGYLGIALAAAASWLGVPGPGEPLLIAAAVYAARGKLDLLEVLLMAWAGAAAGGTAGWLLGRRFGELLVTAPGPLRRQRAAVAARGERFFERYGVLAVYLAPSWVAGSVGMRAARFLPANALAAAIWALLVGLSAYFVGPSIAELIGDLGLAGAIVLGIVAVAAIVAGVLRNRRRNRR